MLPAQFIRDELYHTVRAHPAGGGRHCRGHSGGYFYGSWPLGFNYRGGGSTASPHLPGRGGGRGDGAVGINSVSPPQVSDAALAILSAGSGSLDGYILQADMSTARDELRTLLPGDEFVTDRGNILLAISKRN